MLANIYKFPNIKLIKVCDGTQVTNNQICKTEKVCTFAVHVQRERKKDRQEKCGRNSAIAM